MLGGRSAPRSRSGCNTCRKRKVKCDEERPVCRRCFAARRVCVFTAESAPYQSEPNASNFPSLPRPDTNSNHSSQPVTSPESTASVPQNINSTYGNDVPSVLSRSASSNDGGVSMFITSMQTKTPQWSFVSGLMHICGENPTLMHMMLANVGSQASSMSGRPSDRLTALEHYRLGLKDFAHLVGSGQYESHILLAALWLLSQYELRYGEKAQDIRRHLEGFNSAILTYGDDLIPDLNSKGLSPSTPLRLSRSTSLVPSTRYVNLTNRLCLWMIYQDVLSSTFDLGGSVMQTLMSRYPGAIDRIFAGSRQVGSEIWGAAYPSSEALDDLQNRPAFDFYHDLHILRFEVSGLRRSMQARTADPHHRDRLHNQLLSLAQRYESLLSLADTLPVANEPTPRIILNLRFIATFYYAIKLDFHRVAYFDEALLDAGKDAVSNILKIATIVHETEDGSALSRLAWPMFMVGVETRDFTYQNWVLERYQNFSGYGLNHIRACRLLKAVIVQQRTDSVRVDYLEWIQEGKFDEFII